MSGGGQMFGMGMQMIGQAHANSSEAWAHSQNARAYEEQAQYTEQVGKRKLKLLKRDQDDFFHKQKSSFAKAGVGFDGSVLDFLADSQIQMQEERIAVAAETAQEARASRFKAQQSSQAAADLKSPMALIGIMGGGVKQTAHIFRDEGA